MSRSLFAAAALTLGLISAGACNADHGSNLMADAARGKTAVCEIHPTKGNDIHGTVTFIQMGDKVKVIADLRGLAPNSKHGFHIHEGTECGEDGMKAGGHYNPDKNPHGLPPNPNRHAGDLGNIQADNEGVAHLEETVDNISVEGAKNPIAGRTIMVHAKADDGGQPVGNAGGRIGCGVIKVVQ